MPVGLPDWYSFSKIIHYAQEIAVDFSPFFATRLGNEIIRTGSWSSVAPGDVVCSSNYYVPSGETWFIALVTVTAYSDDPVLLELNIGGSPVLDISGRPGAALSLILPIRVDSGSYVYFCIKNLSSTNTINVTGGFYGWREA